VAFGLLYGMMARQAGFSPLETMTMSLIVHAGSAQFTALMMWNTAGALPIIFTTLAINLRHMLMGASIAPYLRGVRPWWKALLALWMADESYAVAITAYEQGRGSQYYFLGANVGVFLPWPASGLVGALIGGVMPDATRYGLDLVFPLAFLGLLMSFLKDRIGAAVAVSAGVAALVGASLLPGKWYVIVAGLLGSGVGLMLEEAARICKRS